MVLPVNRFAIDTSHLSLKVKRRKQLLTLVICIGFVVIGVGSSLIGPTLIDISSLLNSTIEQVSYGFVVRQICFLIGALFFGWLYTFVNRQLGMAISLTLTSCCIYSIPRLTTLNQFITVQGFLGLVSSSNEVAASAWLLELWRQDSNFYLQCMHFFFAFGSAIGPLISEPYLSPETDGSSPDPNSKSLIIVPYTWAAMAMFTASLIQIAMYIWSPYTQGGEDDDQSVDRDVMEKESLISSETNMDVPKNYLSVLVLSGGLLLGLDVVVEVNSSVYLQAFVVNIGLTKSKGALMLGALSSAFTVGRLVAIFLATQMKPAYMLFGDFALMMIGNLLILLNHSETGLWLGLIILGFGFASCYPTVYAYIGERIQITDMISGVFLFVSSIGNIIEPLIVGKLIVKHPLIFVYVNLFCTSGLIILFSYLNCSKYLTNHSSQVKRT